MEFRPGHLLQVLQVGVEQVAAGQRDPQHGLDDVADGAVVRETDLLCCVHKMATTERAEGREGGGVLVSECVEFLSTESKITKSLNLNHKV